MSIIIGIDHGYYAIKTAHCSFPAGLTSYGEHEPYTRQGLLEFGGCFFVCGSGRQPIQRDKTINNNYYLLTLAAIAKEIRQRGLPPECSVRIAAGLPLTSFGRDKPKFRDYLLRSKPAYLLFENVPGLLNHDGGRTFATILNTLDRLDGYELAFRRGYLTILPKEGASVEGLIWSVTDHDESQLDCYEGYPTFYDKETMTVTDADGTPHEIMVYTMNAPYRDQLLPVSSRYNAVVMQGCLDAGISPQQFYDADEKYRKAYKARAAPCPKKHAPER